MYKRQLSLSLSLSLSLARSLARSPSDYASIDQTEVLLEVTLWQCAIQQRFPEHNKDEVCTVLIWQFFLTRYRLKHSSLSKNVSYQPTLSWPSCLLILTVLYHPTDWRTFICQNHVNMNAFNTHGQCSVPVGRLRCALSSNNVEINALIAHGQCSVLIGQIFVDLNYWPEVPITGLKYYT